MIKKESGSSGKNSMGSNETKETLKKLVVLLSMILIGILLILYRSNYEYWADQFITYNQILFGISLLLLIIILLIFLMDFRNIIKHELLGTIIFFIGALIFMLVPASNFLGVSSLGENSVALFAVGGVIIAVGSILLMRTGGFVGVCVLSILINTMVSAYYVFGDTSAIQYNSNTYLMTNFSILFFIICFILLIYHDLKFFYLASLIKEENSLRRKKEYKKALRYCEKALLIYPYFATAWNNKGNVLVNMGKKKDAIKCYKKALIINPNYIPAKKNLKQFQGI